MMGYFFNECKYNSQVTYRFIKFYISFTVINSLKYPIPGKPICDDRRFSRLSLLFQKPVLG